MYILKFDGMLRTSGNDLPTWRGLLGYGWLVQRSEIEVAHGYGVYLRNCNAGSNAAEYLALIDGLEALLDLRLTSIPIEIRGDAKCVIDQMTGISTVSSYLTRQLYQRASKLARRFRHLTWNWVPRRENQHADSLSRRSFRYLQYSPRLDEQVRRMQIQSGLIPLVDLRVVSPSVQTRGDLTNR